MNCENCQTNFEFIIHLAARTPIGQGQRIYATYKNKFSSALLDCKESIVSKKTEDTVASLSDRP